MWANEQNVTLSKRETLGLSGIIKELVPMSILGLQQWKEKPANSFEDLWQFKVMFKIAIRKMQIKATLNLILPLSELLRMKQPTTIAEQDVEKRKSLDTVDLQTGPITLEPNQHGEFSKTNKQINKNLPHTHQNCSLRYYPTPQTLAQSCLLFAALVTIGREWE